ncbi:MAG TPA: VWA domain-containing protein, partial [Pyrinomonadaceae bacterium]|nr:VWA domain-containing protein [Pyrinomonadaceae bacterium]
MSKIRFTAFFFLLFVFAGTGPAQSGRRIAPTPTPQPSVVEDAATYSESATTPKRPARIWPTLRGETTQRQQPNAQPTKTVIATPTDTADDGEDGVQRVETNLITIPVSVFDRHGLYIPNLRKEDFKIFEDGKEQQIEYFGTSEKPFTVVLLIDTSPSTEYAIDEIRDGARAFVDQLKPQDKVMVVEFDGNVQVLSEPTGDRPTIFKAIKKADFGGGTALYDAVNFSLSQRLNSITGRKAIVLFTDGVDTM